MKRIMPLLVAFIFPVTAYASEWKTYINNGVGYSIEYPANLKHIPYRVWAPNGNPSSSQQWRLQKFEAEGGKVSLEIYTHPTEHSLQDLFNDEVAERTKGGDQINYSVMKDHWFVISGSNVKGFEFYHKLFMGESPAQGNWFIDFDFTYPISQREIYDPITSRIARSFNPSLPGEHEH